MVPVRKGMKWLGKGRKLQKLNLLSMIVFCKTLLEILQSLQNESESISEASNPPTICTAGLINTPTSTTAVEDNIRNIEENISVTQEELITKN